MILNRTASVWRMIGTPSSFVETQVYGSVRCAIIPISSLDVQQPYAFQSTHVVWMPFWAELMKEDQIRWGRRKDRYGNVTPWVYFVVGRRDFREGPRQLAWYAQERD